MELIRYCDDFVVCCESEKDAKNFLELLYARLGQFSLEEVSEEKIKILKFRRLVWKQSQRSREKVETFTFLGFTHYCGKSRQGYFVMDHRTSKENPLRKLKEIKE